MFWVDSVRFGLLSSSHFHVELTPPPLAPSPYRLPPYFLRRQERGSVVLLLNSGNPAPLYTWRLPDDVPVCLRLLVDTAAASGGREGVLCLTQKGDLILLSVASGGGDGGNLPRRSQVRNGYGV